MRSVGHCVRSRPLPQCGRSHLSVTLCGLHVNISKLCALIDHDSGLLSVYKLHVCPSAFTACCGSPWAMASVWFHWLITMRCSGTSRRAPHKPRYETHTNWKSHSHRLHSSRLIIWEPSFYFFFLVLTETYFHWQNSCLHYSHMFIKSICKDLR